MYQKLMFPQTVKCLPPQNSKRVLSPLYRKMTLVTKINIWVMFPYGFRNDNIVSSKKLTFSSFLSNSVKSRQGWYGLNKLL